MESQPLSDSVATMALASAFIARARSFLLTDYLPKIERCFEHLTDQQIWWRPNDESNSIGNLVLHLCGNARQWIVAGLGNQLDERDRDAEFTQREVISRAVLSRHLRETLNEVDRVLDDLNPATLLERRLIQGKSVDALEAIFHVTEHFSMHTGQIIQLTKILVQKDLAFYEFPDDVPVNRWR